MIILGLTGGIGTGKSWISTCFKRLNVPVFDADLYVHQLLAPRGKAVTAIGKLFPEVIALHGGVDRKALGKKVFSDRIARKQLEKIVHPLVRNAEKAFIHQHARRNTPLIVLDIPLLYETKADRLCDVVAVVHTGESKRQTRLIRRGTHDPETLARIKHLQDDEKEKQKQADFLIPNGLSKTYSLQAVKHLINRLKTHGTRNRTRYGNHRI